MARIRRSMIPSLLLVALIPAAALSGQSRSARDVASGGVGTAIPTPVAAEKERSSRALSELFTLSFMAGYSTMASMNWEVEAQFPKLPFSLGLEFAYERLDLIAYQGDVLSLSLLGRWWPLDGTGKKGPVLSIGAGGSVDCADGPVAGPFRFAAGWRFELEGDLGQIRLARPLRLQPELGASWSARPRWQDKYSDIIGLLPFAGIKIGI